MIGIRLIYNRNFESIEAREEVLSYIYTFFPLKDAQFIPFIKDEFRVDGTMEDAGAINDAVLQEILNSLSVENYLGTHRHVDNFYSDYYESETDFINVLFSCDDFMCYVEAVFYTTKIYYEN